MVNSVRGKQKKGGRKMVKYMRKSEVIGEVAVMEVNHAHAAVQSSLGVRTRAKTLALQKSSAEISGDDGSYLQLRSRRLVKPTPPIVPEAKRKKHPQPKSGKGKVGPLNFEEEKEEQIDGLEGKLEAEENNQKDEKNGGDGEMEASFGENLLEFDDKERTTRESTPCNLIMDQNAIQTPSSSNRRTTHNEAINRMQNPMLRNIPTADEMDEFFAREEKQQQTLFIEKYNFDPVNDKPLPGRYEWVKLKP
ncbi:cyclin-dependent kinase inhibitor 5-like [Olea europaea subsp. europaea]|uniref:Cyclin-dependent kinase inhibitor 5-like n=2 Tax=Olea europaea subsp. europaea TaxID=158383 RepID=A0A8S0P7H6_OLEEU|nr:cyclin-dependent kinase inhibitor 5-like [Olea europaea subsp. europaea]